MVATTTMATGTADGQTAWESILVTAAEAAAMLGITPAGVRSAKMRGALVPVNGGTRISRSDALLFERSAIQEYKDNRPWTRKPGRKTGESEPRYAPEGMLSSTEAATYLGLSRQRIHQIVNAGQIKPDATKGRRRFFRPETLDALRAPA